MSTISTMRIGALLLLLALAFLVGFGVTDFVASISLSTPAPVYDSPVHVPGETPIDCPLHDPGATPIPEAKALGCD